MITYRRLPASVQLIVIAVLSFTLLAACQSVGAPSVTLRIVSGSENQTLEPIIRTGQNPMAMLSK